MPSRRKRKRYRRRICRTEATAQNPNSDAYAEQISGGLGGSFSRSRAVTGGWCKGPLIRIGPSSRLSRSPFATPSGRRSIIRRPALRLRRRGSCWRWIRQISGFGNALPGVLGSAVESSRIVNRASPIRPSQNPDRIAASHGDLGKMRLCQPKCRQKSQAITNQCLTVL